MKGAGARTRMPREFTLQGGCSSVTTALRRTRAVPTSAGSGPVGVRAEPRETSISATGSKQDNHSANERHVIRSLRAVPAIAAALSAVGTDFVPLHSLALIGAPWL
jgi:hypothetical protein